jgi:lycopene cyclase domain-containing protein
VDQYQYLLLMAGCLVLTLPLELVLGARVWRRPRELALALLPVVAIYSVWDVVAIHRDVWGYSARFTTGIELPFSMPVEELVFFVVVPICGLLTYGAVGSVLDRFSRAGRGVGSQRGSGRA